MKMTRQRSSFTLIEMLVVVAVIAILAGMVFRMMAYATRNAQRSNCKATLEKLANAINEFRAEYGQYPPATTVVYLAECACDNCQTPFLDTWFFATNSWGVQNGRPILFENNLMSFLMPRNPSDWPRNIYALLGGQAGHDIKVMHFNNDQWCPDARRDVNAKRRWAHFLEGIISIDSIGYWVINIDDPQDWYTDWRATVKDPWGQDMHYQSAAPYQTFRLWSSGPDGGTDSQNLAAPVNDDDVILGTMDR